MPTYTQVDADLSAPVLSDDAKPELNTPVGTAPAGDVDEKKQDEPAKVFTQAEVDAMVQKRLVKEERRFAKRYEQQQREQQQSDVLKVEPQRDHFRDDQAYIDAQIEHRAAVLASQRLAEREQAAEAERRSESFIEKAEKASERYADFQQVVGNPLLRINDAMAEYISESELGADVAYHLGKHPAQAAQIAALSPVKAARELARLESELASKPKAQPSKAPEPITPVGTRGKASTSSLPGDDDDINTWMRKEQARTRSR